MKGLHPAGLAAPGHDGGTDDFNQLLWCHGTSGLLCDDRVEVLGHLVVPAHGGQSTHEFFGVGKGIGHSVVRGKGVAGNDVRYHENTLRSRRMA